MSRDARPAFVVLVTHGDHLTPDVHGPYSREVAMTQSDRLRTHIRDIGGTGEYRVNIAPIARGPIKVRSYR